MKHFYLISYDISNDKRRLKVMKALEDYGTRVQYSVFECWLRPQDLKSLKNHDNIAAISHRQIKQVLFKRFSIDDVKHVKDKNVLISENRDTRSISIEYEVRTPVFGNIDLIVGFSNEIEVHR